MAPTIIQSGSLWLAAMPAAIWAGLFLGAQIMRRYSLTDDHLPPRRFSDGQVEWGATLAICLLLGFFLGGFVPDFMPG